jgi:radical SAM/Cys-rich protein
MSRAVADRVLDLLAASPAIDLVDITGGAPELCAEFERLVDGARALGRRVMSRCNLTILLEKGQEDLGRFLADRRVELVASMPCYTAENVDGQRGKGVFERSIEGLRLLNALGYGAPGSGLVLDLVYNPGGPFLPPPQERLRERYAVELAAFGVRFDRLLTITNMPIARFAEQLARRGELDAYMALLVSHFNPATVPELMCRALVSVGCDGALFDCDFNQMLEMPLRDGERALTVFDVESTAHLEGLPVATDRHCFGCTAGAGSSCGGALGT